MSPGLACGGHRYAVVVLEAMESAWAGAPRAEHRMLADGRPVEAVRGRGLELLGGNRGAAQPSRAGIDGETLADVAGRHLLGGGRRVNSLALAFSSSGVEDHDGDVRPLGEVLRVRRPRRGDPVEVGVLG